MRSANDFRVGYNRILFCLPNFDCESCPPIHDNKRIANVKIRGAKRIQLKQSKVAPTLAHIENIRRRGRWDPNIHFSSLAICTAYPNEPWKRTADVGMRRGTHSYHPSSDQRQNSISSCTSSDDSSESESDAFCCYPARSGPTLDWQNRAVSCEYTQHRFRV